MKGRKRQRVKAEREAEKKMRQTDKEKTKLVLIASDDHIHCSNIRLGEVQSWRLTFYGRGESFWRSTVITECDDIFQQNKNASSKYTLVLFYTGYLGYQESTFFFWNAGTQGSNEITACLQVGSDLHVTGLLSVLVSGLSPDTSIMSCIKSNGLRVMSGSWIGSHNELRGWRY